MDQRNATETRKHEISRQRKSLPIAFAEAQLVEEVRWHDVLIVIGETGSGKSTQIPQFLFDAGFCCGGKLIGVTQPRRVAAVTVATRVAEECGSVLGQKVGYSIRFDDKTSGSTRIKYMTDGMLVREAMLDPNLSRYSVMIVDEAHERSVHTDMSLGLLKKVQMALSESNAPPCSNQDQDQGMRLCPLKLIIMSASLDAKIFSDYFGGAKIVHVHGRQFPVDIVYTRLPVPDYVDATIQTIFEIHERESPGDVLAFLTGQEEIESAERLIKQRLHRLPISDQMIIIVPMHSSLPSELQVRAFEPTPSEFRKVVLATHIAETSVTIPGIKYVIDPGVVKMRYYDSSRGLESLVIVPISKAQALQRSGRAGRLGPGKCFRVYPKLEFKRLEASTRPEIRRCDISSVILQLKALGVHDIVGFFMEKPNRRAIEKSLMQLYWLGALTKKGRLSGMGRQMSQLPLDAKFARALILASEFKCLEEMLIAVAMLSVESIFYCPPDELEQGRTTIKKFSSAEGDHLTLINVYRAAQKYLQENNYTSVGKGKANKVLKEWCMDNFINSRSLSHAREFHGQILEHVKQMGLYVSSCGDDMLRFRRCLCSSFFLNAALCHRDKTYRALGSDQEVLIHPSSVLFGSKPECVVYNELVHTSHRFIRIATVVDSAWLIELAPQYYSLH